MRPIGRVVLAAGLMLATTLSQGRATLAAAPAGADGNLTACRAVRWLHTQQFPDGSFGLLLPNGTAVPSASVTADAVYVLALLGENPAGPAWTRGGHSALDALASLTATFVYSDTGHAGEAGKVARAVALAGGNPRDFGGFDLVSIIQAAYDPATGRYYPKLLYRHTIAMEGLLRSGQPVPPAAVTALLHAQLADGGWSWSFELLQSDVDTTGQVMQVLAGQAGQSASGAFGPAAAYLASVQAAEGGWGIAFPLEPNPPPPHLPSPNANSTALAVGGLVAAGQDPQAPPFEKNGRGAMDNLLAFQEASGAFRYKLEPTKEEYRLIATLDALSTLALRLGQPPVCSFIYLPTLLQK